jgi:hypothetical protein
VNFVRTFGPAVCCLILSAGCSGGSTSVAPLPAATGMPIASPTPSALPSSATSLAVTPAASTFVLPAVNGATASVTFGAVTPPAGTTIAVTGSATAPAGITALQSGRRRAQSVTRTTLAYYSWTPSATVSLSAFPQFTIAFPASLVLAGTTLHEAFLDASSAQPVYQLDVAFGANGSTLTSSATAPTLQAGKTYVFVIYLETNATPAPTSSPTSVPTASPTPVATATPAASGEITVPASISTQAVGQASITNIAYFSGFTGTHVFGHGAISQFNGGTQTPINDCKLTITATDVKLEGGGQTAVNPLISSNINIATQVFGLNDPFALGGSEHLQFFSMTGGTNVFIFAGRVTAASASQGGPVISCASENATNIVTDRSLDTLKFPAAALAALSKNAGTNVVYSQASIKASDFGGAAGTAMLGRGVLKNGNGASLVNDCSASVNGGTVTVTANAGAFTRSVTFTGASSDTAQVATVQGHPVLYSFTSLAGGPMVMTVNDSGYVTQVNVGSGTLVCPV